MVGPGPRLQGPDEIGDACDAVIRAPLGQLPHEAAREGRIAKVRGSDLDGVRPGDEVLDDVLDGLDPPIPKIGTFGNAVLTSHTMRRATGRIAGPERPPVVKPIFGSRRSRSIARPTSVLIRESASAPASTAARADATMSVTFGESLTMSG